MISIKGNTKVGGKYDVFLSVYFHRRDKAEGLEKNLEIIFLGFTFFLGLSPGRTLDFAVM